jgi:hypothetical protein
MNVAVFQSRIAKYGWAPEGGIFGAQRRIFSNGIRSFHTGNVFLSVALVLLVYQYSLTVGLIATGVIVTFVTYLIILNFGGFRKLYSRSARPNR